MRALLLHEDGRCEEITVAPGLGGLYNALSTDTGGCTNVEALPIFPPRPGRDDATLWIDGEGKDVRPHNPFATVWLRIHRLLFPGDYLAGPLLLIGFNPRSGSSRPLPADIGLDHVHRDIDRFLSRPGRGGP